MTNYWKTKLKRWLPLAAGLWLCSPGWAAEPPALPPFQEVYGLVKSNLVGVTSSELEVASVSGLIEQLRGRVQIVTGSGSLESPGTAGALSRSVLFEDSHVYLRIQRIGPSLASLISSEFDKLVVAKTAKGLILDLRFAGGDDYLAAVEVVDRFLDAEAPQLDVAGQTLRSTTKHPAMSVPVAILVNRQTSGAAEVVAALMRQNDIGIVIGATTAGHAFTYRDFPLSTGQRLRIASGKIAMASGKPFPTDGLTPDITVEVKPEDEANYFEDSYREVTRSLTTSADTPGIRSRPRPNEAELVRRQKDGSISELESASSAAAKSLLGKQRIIQDPALARAVDLLKGLALVRKQPAP
jgi:hypothetical protein